MATKAELEIEVEYLKGQLSEKEGELATANEQITERDSRIEDLNQQIADANEGHDENRVADLERQIAEKDVALGELSAKVTDLEMAIALGDLFVGRGEFAFLFGKLALEVPDLDFKFCLCGHGGLLCCNAATLPQPCRSCL